MNRAQTEAKLIKVQRTIAVDLKAIADLDKRASKKRATVSALQADEARLKTQLRDKS